METQDQNAEQARQGIDQFVVCFLRAVEQDDPAQAWILLRQELDRIQTALDSRADKPVPKSAMSLIEYLWPEVDHGSDEQGVAFYAAIHGVAEQWCDGEGERRAFGESLLDRSADQPREWDRTDLAFVDELAGKIRPHLNEILSRMYGTSQRVAQLDTRSNEAAEAIQNVVAKVSELVAEHSRLSVLLEQGLPSGKSGVKLKYGEMAILLQVRNPSRSPADIARELGCSQSTLSRSPLYIAARKALLPDTDRIPVGYKNAKTGKMDAWGPEE